MCECRVMPFHVAVCSMACVVVIYKTECRIFRSVYFVVVCNRRDVFIGCSYMCLLGGRGDT
jgi:hypothetical protein